MGKLRSIWRYLGELRRALRQSPRALRDGGASIPRQLCELLLLRAGPGKLTPEDYYLMRVYRRGLSLAEKSKYISTPTMGAIARDRRWDLVAHDKLLTYGVLLGHGIRVPEILAVVHATRAFGNRPTLQSPAELEAYLTGQAPYPFFSKPVLGIYSKGSMLVEALDSARSSLLLGDGSSICLKDYVQQSFKRKSGYLIQELLHPHPEIAALVGDRVCTVRMMVLFDDGGPRLYRALWKIAALENIADNYWRKGNILCLLDNEDGTVRHCTTGLGPELREIDRHPATNAHLPGFAIPQWEELRHLTLRAARTMPVQAWDIAPTSKGPMALEVNVFGILFLPQVAEQSGLYQGEFCAFMEAHRR